MVFDLIRRHLPDRSERGESLSLVRLHETGVANHIRRHNGREAVSEVLVLFHEAAQDSARKVFAYPI
jgi:hypothetical protein